MDRYDLIVLGAGAPSSSRVASPSGAGSPAPKPAPKCRKPRSVEILWEMLVVVRLAHG